MITLCGFPVSNYYNVVKMALLEKGVAFTEELVYPRSTDEAVLSASPLGKIPYIKTAQGSICESKAILQYIEAAFPSPALFPTDPFALGKVQEMMIYIDLHLELVARELYGAAFFGGKASDEQKERVHKTLAHNIEGFKRLVQFAPWVAGTSFGMADIVAFNNLPLVGMSTRAVYGEDLLLAAGVDYKPYIKMVEERSSAQKVVADRKAASAAAATKR